MRDNARSQGAIHAYTHWLFACSGKNNGDFPGGFHLFFLSQFPGVSFGGTYIILDFALRPDLAGYAADGF
jgi:hypothetical protein